MPRCPNCNKLYFGNPEYCPHCEYNFELGRVVTGEELFSKYGDTDGELIREERNCIAWGQSIKRSKCLGISTYTVGNTAGSFGSYTVHTQGTFALEYIDGSIDSVTFDIDSPYYLECVKKLEW